MASEKKERLNPCFKQAVPPITRRSKKKKKKKINVASDLLVWHSYMTGGSSIIR